MKKELCWEVMKCGREVGGNRSKDLGVCPAATEKRVDGMNNGKNAGRICWTVAGTLCSGEVEGTFASKIDNCLKCEFYKLVKTEEGAQSSKMEEAMKKLSDEK